MRSKEDTSLTTRPKDPVKKSARKAASWVSIRARAKGKVKRS